jgi:hypothetical protein
VKQVYVTYETLIKTYETLLGNIAILDMKHRKATYETLFATCETWHMKHMQHMQHDYNNWCNMSALMVCHLMFMLDDAS